MRIILPFFLLVMVMLVMPRVEDVPDDLENEDGFEAAGEFEVDNGIDEESESGDVDPYPEPSRTRVCGQDILCWRKRASFDVSLDDYSGLQTYLEEEFPYLPHTVSISHLE